MENLLISNQRLEGKQSYHYAATLNNIALVYIDIAHYDKALTMAKKIPLGLFKNSQNI